MTDVLKQVNRINVDAGVMVTMSLEAYNIMRDQHATTERYAEHVAEAQREAAAAGLREKEAKDKATDLEQQVTQLTAQLSEAMKGRKTKGGEGTLVHVQQPVIIKPAKSAKKK